VERKPGLATFKRSLSAIRAGALDSRRDLQLRVTAGRRETGSGLPTASEYASLDSIDVTFVFYH